MTTDVVWSRRARRALLDIYVAIGRKNPAAAERIYLRLEALADSLSRYPRLGPRRPDIRPSVRILVESPYLLLYETSPDTDEGVIATVEIISVVDGRRDLSREF